MSENSQQVAINVWVVVIRLSALRMAVSQLVFEGQNENKFLSIKTPELNVARFYDVTYRASPRSWMLISLTWVTVIRTDCSQNEPAKTKLFN